MLADQQVIEQVATRLVAAATAAGANVERGNRARKFATFPGLKVYAVDTAFDDEAEDVTWPHARTSTLQVNVDGVVRDTTDLEAAMHALAEQVLAALEGTAAASTLAPLQGVRLRAARITRRVQDDGEQATGTVGLVFDVVFQTNSNDPATFI